MSRMLVGTAALVALVSVTACTSDTTEGGGAPSAAESASSSAAPDPSDGGSEAEPVSPSPDPEPSTSRSPRPRPSPVSLPALFDKEYVGGGLRNRGVIARTDAYTSYSVSYRSNNVRVSGKLDVPRGKGPFPALVLAHGYIDPAIYDNGQGMRREQDWLARAGFVVLHTDYRNHAFSDDVPSAELRLRLGYTTDTINAVKTLRRTDFAPVDDERIGLVGRSMGGGVVYNVVTAQPGLVDAAVVFAPVSSLTAQNFNRWTREDPVGQEILAAYGEPAQNQRFWRQASPRPYFGRITEPVLIHHGTADESCPLRWSRATHRALQSAGVDSTLRVYRGEPHAFIDQWPLSMRRTESFLRRHLR